LRAGETARKKTCYSRKARARAALRLAALPRSPPRLVNLRAEARNTLRALEGRGMDAVPRLSYCGAKRRDAFGGGPLSAPAAGARSAVGRGSR
jgi:hypothetical protein